MDNLLNYSDHCYLIVVPPWNRDPGSIYTRLHFVFNPDLHLLLSKPKYITLLDLDLAIKRKEKDFKESEFRHQILSILLY